VLVTGASGFIGGHLAELLAASGYQVRGAVREGVVPGNVERVVAGDLARPGDLDPLVRNVEIVIHCAARAHVTREGAGDALARYRAVNRDGTLRLAEAAAKAGVRRFLFLSSIGVLGERTGEVPFGPGSRPSPVADYAISKWEAEEGLRALAARSAMEMVVIRPTLVHGPGAPGNFGRLLGLVASGIPLPFAAVGGRRTFIGRANLCSLILAAMTHPEAPKAPLLAGDREALTLPELLRILADQMGRPLRLFPMPGLPLLSTLPVVGGPLRKLTDSLVVDTSETNSRLGWMPSESAEAGIRAMAKAWKDAR
jgi:nucleoside-diphosphate-sugar epimerase